MTKVHQSQLKLKKLTWLLGHWEGEGVSENQSQHGFLQAELRLDDSFLVITESIYVDNKLVHEDCTWCHWKPSEQHFIAQQFMPVANSEQRIIIVDQKIQAMRWWAGPSSPSVHIVLNEDVLHVQVIGADKHSWSHMQYKKTTEPS